MADINQGPLSSVYDSCMKQFTLIKVVPYQLRADLFRKIGDTLKSSSDSNAQWLFNVLLFWRCADYSYNIWNKQVKDDFLGKYKEIIEQKIVQSISREKFHEFYKLADAHVMDYYYEGSPDFQNTAGLAGLSCIRSLAACADDFSFDDSEENEIDIDTYNWDSAFFTSCSIAGGAEWQTADGVVLNLEARDNFWRWYVDVAIPECYDRATLPQRNP